VAGAHERPSGWWGDLTGRFNTAHWLLFAFTMLAVPAAALAFLFYMLVTGTALQDYGIVLLLWTALLIGAIVRRAKDGSLVWTASGMVLTLVVDFFRTLAHQHDWPPGQQHLLALIGNGVLVASLAIVAVLLVGLVKSSGFKWPRRSSAHEQ
jgi:hypothetical protein